MGKTVTYTPNPDKPVRLTEEQLANQKRLMEEAGDAYFDEIPITTTEEFRNGDWFGIEEEPARYAAALAEYKAKQEQANQEEKEAVTVRLAPQAAAYLRSRGPAFQSRIGAIIEAQIAEAQASEQRS